jgi:hypothetical protein
MGTGGDDERIENTMTRQMEGATLKVAIKTQVWDLKGDFKDEVNKAMTDKVRHLLKERFDEVIVSGTCAI